MKTHGRPAQRVRIALAAGLIALALWVGWVPAAPAQEVPVSPQGPLTLPNPSVAGRLLFTRDGGLWMLRLADGQTPTQVVQRPRVGMILTARWAPDASRFAFTQYEVSLERNAPVSSINVAAADGSERRALVTGDEPGTQLQQPTWSPDGRSIYFLHRKASVNDSIQRIERVDVTTGERTVAVQAYGEFDLSPDGRWLAVIEAPGGKPTLTLLDLRAGTTTTLLAPGLYDALSAPRFDPTSQTIAFSGLRWSDVGQNPSGPGIADLPPSLLGATIARAHGLPMDIYTVPVAGGSPRRLTKLMLDDPVSTWAPDGAQLAVLSAEFLALTPAAEGTPAPILTPGAYGSVDWAK